MAVEANHVNVIPPGATMEMVDEHLTLPARPPRPVPHMPIDHLLRSLAEIRRGRTAARAIASARLSTATASCGGFREASVPTASPRPMPARRTPSRRVLIRPARRGEPDARKHRRPAPFGNRPPVPEQRRGQVAIATNLIIGPHIGDFNRPLPTLQLIASVFPDRFRPQPGDCPRGVGPGRSGVFAPGEFGTYRFSGGRLRRPRPGVRRTRTSEIRPSHDASPSLPRR